MGNFSKRPERHNAYNWQMLPLLVVKRQFEDLPREEVRAKCDEVYGTLAVISDLLWEGFCKQAHLDTIEEKKLAAKDLKQSIDPDSIYYILVSQGAKRDIFDFPRGKGIGMRQKNESKEQSHTK